MGPNSTEFSRRAAPVPHRRHRQLDEGIALVTAAFAMNQEDPNDVLLGVNETKRAVAAAMAICP